MKLTPLVIAAHFLAAAYFTDRRPGATFSQVRRLADAHWPAFLADASAPMGRLLLGEPSPEGRFDFAEAMQRVSEAAQR